MPMLTAKKPSAWCQCKLQIQQTGMNVSWLGLRMIVCDFSRSLTGPKPGVTQQRSRAENGRPDLLQKLLPGSRLAMNEPGPKKTATGLRIAHLAGPCWVPERSRIAGRRLRLHLYHSGRCSYQCQASRPMFESSQGR